jgi:hypothetical protein
MLNESINLVYKNPFLTIHRRLKLTPPNSSNPPTPPPPPPPYADYTNTGHTEV